MKNQNKIRETFFDSKFGGHSTLKFDFKNDCYTIKQEFDSLKIEKNDKVIFHSKFDFKTNEYVTNLDKTSKSLKNAMIKHNQEVISQKTVITSSDFVFRDTAELFEKN